MAALTTDRSRSKLRYAIQFTYGTMPDGRPKRNTVRLGALSRRQAESARRFVEALLGARIGGTAPTPATLEWLAGLPPMVRRRLERVGLIEPAEQHRYTLGGWLAEYFDSRTDWKPRTLSNAHYARVAAESFFGKDTPLAAITPGGADEFRRHLLAAGMAEATTRRRCKWLRQFLRAAVKRRLLTDNPFADVATHTTANASRFYFVSREEAAAVLEACPDADWRLIFALCRYGGLRCPSEVLGLKWSDVDWAAGRFIVRSPKTEHHADGGVRVVPIFPELKPHLQEAYDLAEEGARFCIRRYRGGDANLRTRMRHIIERAGLAVWPKLFQNLRSTRETELAEAFPIHVVCQWIGNSAAVANKHYLQVTQDHFDQAAGAGQAGNAATQEPSRRDGS